MNALRLALAGLALAAATLPALAADVVTARDPEGVLKAVGDLGYQGTLETGTNGSRSIKLLIDGSTSYIDFFNCDDDKTNCETLLFAYGMDLDKGTTAEKANEWNYDTLYGFVYLDKTDDPWLNMTVGTGDGIPSALFADLMKMWRTRTSDVRDFFDF